MLINNTAVVSLDTCICVYSSCCVGGLFFLGVTIIVPDSESFLFFVFYFYLFIFQLLRGFCFAVLYSGLEFKI